MRNCGISGSSSSPRRSSPPRSFRGSLGTTCDGRQEFKHYAKTVRSAFPDWHNQVEEILPWYETGYRFMKRQSQADPNVWVNLSDSRTAPAAASITKRQTSKAQPRGIAPGMTAAPVGGG